MSATDEVIRIIHNYGANAVANAMIQQGHRPAMLTALDTDGGRKKDLGGLARDGETDASLWAKAFINQIKFGLDPEDEGWMIGVFTNAIEAGRRAGEDGARKWPRQETARSNSDYIQASDEVPMGEWQDGGRYQQFRIPDDLPQASYIMRVLVSNWWELFLVNNRKYKDVDQSLGSKGVFPDINRKVGALKSRIWNEEDEPDEGMGESTTRIISDLIGHLFLLWWMLDSPYVITGEIKGSDLEGNNPVGIYDPTHQEGWKEGGPVNGPGSH